MKAPKDLMNATEVKTRGNGVETSRQNAKWPYILIIYNAI